MNLNILPLELKWMIQKKYIDYIYKDVLEEIERKYWEKKFDLVKIELRFYCYFRKSWSCYLRK
jgi:hypothetical protein